MPDTVIGQKNTVPVMPEAIIAHNGCSSVQLTLPVSISLRSKSVLSSQLLCCESEWF
jgi:hypothetical protein